MHAWCRPGNTPPRAVPQWVVSTLLPAAAVAPVGQCCVCRRTGYSCYRKRRQGSTPRADTASHRSVPHQVPKTFPASWAAFCAVVVLGLAFSIKDDVLQYCNKYNLYSSVYSSVYSYLRFVRAPGAGPPRRALFALFGAGVHEPKVLPNTRACVAVCAVCA